MRTNKVLSLALILGLTNGCSSFQKEQKAEKEFKIEASSIRKIGNIENLSHRKISRSVPLVIGDRVLAASSNDGVSLFSKSNQRIWFVDVPGGVETSPVLYNRNRVLVGGKDGNLYSIDLETGKVIWKFFASAEILSDLSIDQGSVYFLAGNNVMFKLDADSGERQWVYSRVQSSSLSIRGGSTPLLLNRKVYIGFSDGYLVCLDQEKGGLIWERRLGNVSGFSDVDSSPVTDGTSVFVSSYDGALYSLSASSGDIQWKLDEGGYFAPAIDAKRLIYPSSKGDIFILDSSSGKKLWTYSLKNSIASSPEIFQNMWAVSTSSGKVLIFDLNNQDLLGSYEPGRGSLAKPVWDSDNKYLLVNSNAGNLHRLRIHWKDPRLDWSWE